MESIAGKKVLLVITKSNWGGAQVYVYTLAVRLKKEGAEVVVALGGTGLPGASTGVLAERLTEAGVRTIVLSSFTRDISILRDIQSFQELRGIIRSERPDVLHLNSSKAGGLGALAGRLEKAPHIIYTAHGWAHRESRNIIKKLLIWLASWITISLSHTVLVVSDLDFRTAPVLFSRKKLVTIRNGINPFPTLPKEEARSILSSRFSALTRASTWVLMQAELTKNKGVDVAIEAFTKLADRHPEAILIVLGEGEDRNRLNELVLTSGLSNKVFLIGFVAESRSYLSSADVFLMASRKEGLPFALLEAGSVGLPVVATRVGGIPEVIVNGETGLLVPPNDAEAVSDAIGSLLADPAKAHELSTRLQEKIRADFSEERMTSETIASYTRV
jgi:glycosyltransferase involved in cell wall biosynthesis